MDDDARSGVTFVSFVIQALSNLGDCEAFIHGNRRMSGREALRAVYRFARVLAARGIGRGDGFAVLAGNLPDAFLVQVAGQMLGARYTGLHPMASADDQEFVMRNAEIGTLIYDPRLHADRGAELVRATGIKRAFSLGLPGPLSDNLLTLAEDQSDEPMPVGARMDDITAIYYTGGTTGNPKGVCHTQSSLLYSALICHGQWEWPEKVRLLLCSPITHGAGWMIAPALARGGSVVLLDGFDACKFVTAIGAERITMTFLVPTMIYDILDLRSLPEADLTSLQTVIYGAAPMSPSRMEACLEQFGQIFVQAYGQTEAGVGVLLLHKLDHDLGRPARLASAGRAPAGIDVTVRADDGSAAAPGDVGEVCVRGPSVMAGYWNMRDLTREVIRDGWLHTGDIGACDDDGYIHLIDRKNDVIVSGGFNVYSRAVEDVLSSHSSVKLAAVIGVPHDRWGEAVHAVVVVQPGATTEREELCALVRDRKGPICVPKSIEFVEDLPLTPVGKTDKKELRRRYWTDRTRWIH